MLLQLWRGGRLALELAVPKGLHGPLVNDGYFASGATWAADESVVAYTAEVRRAGGRAGGDAHAQHWELGLLPTGDRAGEGRDCVAQLHGADLHHQHH